MDFIFEQARVGGDRNFGYLIGDRAAGAAAVVDPSYVPDILLERAKAQGLSVKLILNTHGHADHTHSNARVRQQTGALVAAHFSVPFRSDLALDDGHCLQVGGVAIRVTHVPGHTRDHVVFHLPGERIALTGDHLFVGKVGGTDSDEASRLEYESLQRLLREFPDETTVWPGHDYGCRPSSTILLEKLANPFLRVRGFEEFLELKRDWAAFKARHGLR